jgi:hypothetical protein
MSDISVNSVWRGISSKKVVNVDGLVQNENQDNVLYHVVQQQTPDPEYGIDPLDYPQQQMPRVVFVVRFERIH